MARPGRDVQRNRGLVRETIDACGGVIEVCAALRIANRTVYRWQERDVVTESDDCLALAALRYPKDERAQLRLARRLAYLDE